MKIYDFFDQRINLIKTMRDDPSFGKIIEICAQKISKSFKNSGKLLLCGNGGSAAECQHMAAEYLATLDHKNFRPGLPAIALTTDTSYLTAWTNDFGIDDMFARQIEGLGKSDDVLISYSTSGNSKNVVKAIKLARKLGIYTIGLTGNSGGIIRGIVNSHVCVPSSNTAEIQEIHTAIGHFLCRRVELILGY